MNLHELAIETNRQLSSNVPLTDSQKSAVVKQFLDAKVGVATITIDSEKRHMRPLFFKPPYKDGKKVATIFGQKPKTYILSGNSYELEIIRLLHLLAPQNPDVQTMVKTTLERLKTTCFGRAALWVSALMRHLLPCGF